MRSCVNKHDLVTTPDIDDSHLLIRCSFLLTPHLDMECQLVCKHSDINLHLICLIIVLSLTGRYTHNILKRYIRGTHDMHMGHVPKRHL